MIPDPTSLGSGTARALLTPGGVDVPTITAAQWREVCRVGEADTGPSSRQTLEVAAFQLAACALEMLGVRWSRSTVLVLAGPGGTGAVGVAAARHLANRGIDVVVVTSKRPAEVGGTLGQQLLALGETPALLLPFSAAFDVAAFDLVIDAVIGRGLDGAPRAAVMSLVRAANAGNGAVLSADLPSGLDPDSGLAEGASVRPTRTLAFGLPAKGLASAAAGDLWLADVGLPPGVYARAGVVVPQIFGADTRILLRLD